MKTIDTTMDFVGLPGLSVAVGQIVQVTAEDVPVVDYPGNARGPLAARLAAEVPEAVNGAWPPVLLAFDNGDPSLPIIVGFVRHQMKAPAGKPQPPAAAKLVVDAEEEVLLQCGKSSILLRRDGKIVIKGSDIISRASRQNKIQGSAVRLN